MPVRAAIINTYELPGAQLDRFLMRLRLGYLTAGDETAVLRQRDYVVPDDIKQVAVPALAHRVPLRPELWVRQVCGTCGSAASPCW